MAPDTGRSAAAQLKELGHAIPGEDSPRWHLTAAEEAMDDGQWDAARVALQRARENMAPSSPDRFEARFVALRLAVGTVDLRMATEETMALVEVMDEHDGGWNRRVRDIIAAAPRAFTSSMRAGLTGLLPALPTGTLAEPKGGPAAGAAGAAPADPELFQGDAADVRPEGLREEPIYEIWVDEGEAAPEPPAADPALAAWETGPRWRVRVDPADDLDDADRLRDHLVERMLAQVTDDEFQVLFNTATTFLANGQYDSAEVMFSAAMQAPDLRIAACEGLVQALVRGGRYAEAIANAARATRIFAREDERLAGIVYWQGVAAQESGDVGLARSCFDRVRAWSGAVVYPDLAARRASVGA